MKQLTFLIIAMIHISYFINAQNPQWIVYDTSNSSLPYNGVSTIVIEENGVKWIGAVNIINCEYGGGNSLAAFNGSGWLIYDTTNSALPTGYITSIVIDGNGTKWIGFVSCSFYGETGGLAVFDGTNWGVYDTSNSDLPSTKVLSLATEGNGTIWIGTNGGGLAAFDGTNWVVYNTSNSDLPSNCVTCIAIDGNGTKWIGTHSGGLAAFDGSNWVVYNSSNTGFPIDFINSLSIDQNEIKWLAGDSLMAFDDSTWIGYHSPVFCNIIHMVATEETEANGRIWISTNITPLPAEGCGLTSFDGIDWITYNTNNSELPDNYVFSLAIDENGTKWIGTRGGLAAFNENGIPVGVEELAVGNWQSAVIIYPNPASITISIVLQPDIEVTSLEIINIQGKVVMHQKPMNNDQSFYVGHFPKGLYFVRIHASRGIEVKKLVIQ